MSPGEGQGEQRGAAGYSDMSPGDGAGWTREGRNTIVL